MKQLHKKIKLSTLFISLTVLSYVLVLFLYREKFTAVYNHAELGKTYSESPYVLGPDAKTSIGDDGLFAVAGYYLLVQGGDPMQIHFESPPLGEYFIGLSIALFRNERVINIVYGVLFLFLTYKLGQLVFKQETVASLAPLFIVLDPLFHQHLIASLLDLPQALAVLASVYFFIRAVSKNPREFFIAAFFLGCAVSIKFFPAIIFFIAAEILVVVMVSRKKMRSYLASLILIPVVYAASYAMFFVRNPSLLAFVNFHKYVISWRLGNPKVIGNIITTLLIGRYRDWWGSGTWVTSGEWTILSPLLFLGAMGSIFFQNVRKNQYAKFLYGLSAIFFLYLIFGTTGVAKYIYPIYPFFAILAAFSVQQLLRILPRS